MQFPVVLQSFDESDLLMLIGTLDVPALKSLKITSETLGLLNHPRDKWRLILNRADMKVGLTPAEVEKTLDRYETLVADRGESAVLACFNPDEREVLKEFLEHGAAVRAERARAAALGEKPNFVPLVRSWGGVTIAYRKRMVDSPAYRLNHEEVIKALEEGIVFAENLNPVEAVPDVETLAQLLFFSAGVIRSQKHQQGETFFRAAACNFLRPATSFARNCATASINFTGTGSENGKRIVPLLTSYRARSSLNAVTRGPVAG